jgi:hypothetical protein
MCWPTPDPPGPRHRVAKPAAARGDMLVGAAAVGGFAEEWTGEPTLATGGRASAGVLADVVHLFPAYGEAIEHSLPKPAAGLSEGDHP